VNKRRSQRVAAAAGMLALMAMCGCASKYVQAAVRNQTGGPITLVEVDYRFKILGSGPTKVLWTDAERKQHEVAGPKLDEGQQGTLIVTLTQSGATWNRQLK